MPTDPDWPLGPCYFEIGDVMEATKNISVMLTYIEGCPCEIIKYNAVKYAIKISQDLDGLPFTAKIRIWRRSDSQCVVEVQRRTGDGIGFIRFFRALSEKFSTQAE